MAPMRRRSGAPCRLRSESGRRRRAASSRRHRRRPPDAATECRRARRSLRRSCPSSRTGARRTRASILRTRPAVSVHPGKSSSAHPSVAREMQKDVEVAAGFTRRIHCAVHLADAAFGIRVCARPFHPRWRPAARGARARTWASDGIRPAPRESRAYRAPDGARRDLETRRSDWWRSPTSARTRLLSAASMMSGYARPRAAGIRSTGTFQMAATASRSSAQLELAITRQRGRKPGFARPHGVALARDGERRRARPADVARNERQIVDGVDGLGTFRAVVDAHRPGNESRARRCRRATRSDE